MLRPNRRSIRLRGYDYSQPGAYFVTICTRGWVHLFGDVVDGEMRLNEFGELVRAAWFDLPDHYNHVRLDAFVIMPNHVHSIIILTDDYPSVGAGVGAGFKPAPTMTTMKRHPLSEIVRAFKTFSARRINALRGTPGAPVWQRNYYEHIIRNDRALDAIRRYIVHNPVRWHLDRYNAERVAPDPWAEEIWRMVREPPQQREDKA
ncbi:MAG TPA: transposase [Caldilineae bacterium]|nr:transposase [Caldilineae bacterium]